MSLAAGFGAFLFAPIIVSLWLHRPELFEPYSYGIMVRVSAAISMKDHKQFFQFSTNTHRRLAMIVFCANLLMVGLSVPMVERFGLDGFLTVWLASESSQMALIYLENKKLFDFDRSVSFAPVVKLLCVMLGSLPVCMLMMVLALAIAGEVMLIAECYFVFGLKDVWSQFAEKIRLSPKLA